MQQNMQLPQPQFTFEGGHLVMFHQEETGLPKVTDSNVNDRDRLIDLLAQEKYLTHGYNTAMLEVSHDQIFQVLRKNHMACQDLQRQLFNVAFKKGWYRLPVADPQTLVTTYNRFQQKHAEFPFPSQMSQQKGQMQQGWPQTQGIAQAQPTGQTQTPWPQAANRPTQAASRTH